jgi:hypothetical protein
MLGTVGDTRDVILFTAQRGGLARVLKQLAALGLAVHAARCPSEVIWLLESDRQFSAIFIDGDGPVTAIVEVLSHLVAKHDHVKRFLVMTAPAITEIAGCVVLDKERLDDALPASGSAITR